MRSHKLARCCRQAISPPCPRLRHNSFSAATSSLLQRSYSESPSINSRYLLFSGDTHTPTVAETTYQNQRQDGETDYQNSNTILLRLPKQVSSSSSHYLTIRSIPVDTICSYEALNHALEWSEGSPSTLHLTRLVISSVSSMDIDLATKLIAQTVRKLGKHHIIASLPCLVDLFIYRMRYALRDEAIFASLAAGAQSKQIQDLYGHVLKAIFHFTIDKSSQDGGGDNQPLVQAGKVAIADIVKNLLEVLESLPSSSNSNSVALQPKIVRWIAIKRTFSSELGHMVSSYAERNGIQLSSGFWLTRFMAAVQQKETKTAVLSLRKAQEIRQREGKSGDIFLRSHAWQHGIVEEQGQAQESQGGQSSASSLSTSWSDRNKDRIPIAIAKMSQSFDKFASTLEPWLREMPPDVSTSTIDTQRYAWCMLFDMTSKQPDTTPADILNLYHSMPPSAICAYTLTPIMQALLHLGVPDQAWTIWTESLNLQKAHTEQDQQSRYVDSVSLAVATEACFRVAGLDTAIQLVDRHAIRPASRRVTSRSEDDIMINIDVTNVNILLSLCVKERAPSIAFRLWAASLPRWGVRMNGISLSQILDASRFCEFGSEPDKWVEDFGTRFRLLMDEFSFRRRKSGDREGAVREGGDKEGVGGGNEDGDPHTYDAYDDDGFSKGGYQVLLDPPGFKWYQQFGTFRPWQQSRQIFRDVVLGNWPFLKGLQSPLHLSSQHGMGSFDFLSSIFGSVPPTGPQVLAEEGERETGEDVDPERQKAILATMRDRIPVQKARYPYLIPTQGTWHAYISLLGVFNLVEEIPLTLMWMKALGVRPTMKCMTSALTFIGEVEGPRRRIKGWYPDGSAKLVRDEQIMRRWLIEWFGDEALVPSEEDVINRRRFIMERGWKLIL